MTMGLPTTGRIKKMLRGARVYALFGVASLSAWLLLLAVSPVFSRTPTLAGEVPSWRLLVCVVTACAFAVVATSSRVGQWVSSGRTHFFAIAACCGACGLFGVLIIEFSQSLALGVVSSAMTAVTLVLLCCVWTCRISSVMLRDRVLILAGGVMAGCVVYSIVALIPQPFALFVGGCLPATSIAFAFAADSADAPRGYSSQGGVSVFPFEVELASSAILFGVLFVLCGHAFPDREAQWVSAVAPGMIHVAALFVLEAIITLVMMFGSGRTNPLIAVRPSAIVVAVSLLLLPFASEIWRMGCLALAFAGFGSFMVYFVIVMGNISQERGANASQVCAWGMLLVVAGALIGEALSVALLAIRPIMPIDYVSALSICGLFVMVVMQWGMAKRYDLAHETREMGGHYFLDERPAEALKFQEIARHFSLSPRETEVLVMLAKGRSIPYICEALCISKSTAQTHVRHIYDKMEVSEGRQGLIDAIEQFGAQ